MAKSVYTPVMSKAIAITGKVLLTDFKKVIT